MAFVDPSWSNAEVEDRRPAPAGRYLVKIEKSEIKDTRAGNGKIFAIRGRIKEGEFKGRSFFDNMNIVNGNPTAQEIGRKSLTQLRMFAGIAEGQLKDSDQVVGAEGWVKLAIEADDGNERNKVVYYEPKEEGSSSVFDEAPKTATASAFDNRGSQGVTSVPPKKEAKKDENFAPWL